MAADRLKWFTSKQLLNAYSGFRKVVVERKSGLTQSGRITLKVVYLKVVAEGCQERLPRHLQGEFF